MKSLKEEIKRYTPVDNYADYILEIIRNRITQLYPKYIDSQYNTGYYNAIADIVRLLKQ